MNWLGCIAVLGLFAPAALADLTGRAEAGLVIASGNTETETANAKASLANELGDWKHKFGGSALYASDDDGKTANRWEVFGESDYSFSPRTFWFGAARYEQDEFSGFEYQAAASSGLGRKFIDTDRTQFNGTLGVGYKFLETRPALDDFGVLIAPRESDSEAILRSTLDLDHDFTETTTLLNKMTIEAGADNTFVQNVISLQVKINAVLALALGYTVRHNTEPPPSFEDTDTLTTVNLVYELK